MLKSISIVLALVAFAAHPVQAATTTINTTTTYQTIEGLGGAVAFYDGWVPAHPYKLEIYTNAFAGLHLSMLRFGDWYRYNAGFNSASGEGGVAGDIVANANRVLGHPVPVYMSSWSPPAFLKNNGQVGNGGSLIYTNGSFAYTNFAQYWYDSLQAYKTNGVTPTWISIQNEPDWVAGYDSCIFHPSEDSGTNYASYSKALDATFQRLTNMPSPPKILAPEVVHIAYNDLANYAATMNSSSFYGINYHLYGGNNSDLSSSTNIFPGKPHFMTEFGVDGLIETATLIHNCLTLGQDSGFNYWSLIWPGTTGGLIQIENPFASHSTWTNAPPGVTTDSHGWWLTPAYWAMKHFSYFIQPGYRRVSATDNDNNVSSSAYLSPDNLRLVVVLINTSATTSSTMTFNFGIFSVGKSSIYQTAGTNTYAGTNTFLSLGSLTNSLVLPPLSLTTVVLDQPVNVGPASNPSPASGASGIVLNTALSWMPGSNALAHALYLGTDSNTVAQATPASPQFLGILTTNTFYPVLAGETTYFWRVDEMNSANTNIGTVWSFSTVPMFVGPATNPSPAGGASAIAFNTALNWMPGSNALTHAVYLGTDSNAVAQATTASPQFVGVVTTNNFYPPLVGGTIYFWRVDEMNSANTNVGTVWSFSTVPVPLLVHHYSFSETGGTNTADSVGGPGWTGTLPNSGTFGGGQLTLSASSQQYVSLPAGIVSPLSNFTVVAWVQLVSTASWARIFDFGNNTTVYMFLTPQYIVTGKVRYAITTTGVVGEQHIDCNSTLSTGVWHQVAVTLNANTGILYVDGVPVGTNSAMTLNPLSLGRTTNNYLGKSQYAQPYLDGLMDEFRIYSVALSSAEVAATYALGPDQLLSTNSPTAVASMSGTNLTMSWPVASAGFTLQSSTNLASGNWVTVTSAEPQIVSGQWQVTIPISNTASSIFYRLLK